MGTPIQVRPTARPIGGCKIQLIYGCTQSATENRCAATGDGRNAFPHRSGVAILATGVMDRNVEVSMLAAEHHHPRTVASAYPARSLPGAKVQAQVPPIHSGADPNRACWPVISAHATRRAAAAPPCRERILDVYLGLVRHGCSATVRTARTLCGARGGAHCMRGPGEAPEAHAPCSRGAATLHPQGL